MQAQPIQGEYNPDEYAGLEVDSEIRQLFDYIGRFKPNFMELEASIKVLQKYEGVCARVSARGRRGGRVSEDAAARYGAGTARPFYCRRASAQLVQKGQIRPHDERVHEEKKSGPESGRAHHRTSAEEPQGDTRLD
mgnify:CR=1 FL=1